MMAVRRMRVPKVLPAAFVRTMSSATSAQIRVKTYNAISPIGLQVYDSQYDVSPVRPIFILLAGFVCSRRLTREV